MALSFCRTDFFRAWPGMMKVADVTVLTKPSRNFTPRWLASSSAAYGWYQESRDDHINVMIWAFTQDLVGRFLAHAQARLIDRDAVDDRIRTRQIDVFENARCIFWVAAH